MKDKITRQCSLFCFKGFFNHNRKSNVRFEYKHNVLMMYVDHDLQKGEELFFDYCEGITD